MDALRNLFFLNRKTLIFSAFIASALTACIQHPTAPVSDLSPIPGARKGQLPGHYAVKKGDTLYSIAFRTGTDYKQLAAWNGIASPYTIYVDDQLRLTPPAAGQTPKPATPAQKPAQKRQPSRPSTPPTANLPRDVALWRWPAEGKLIAKFAPAKGINGIQVSARSATPVNAAASGQVVYAGSGIRGYGQLLIVKHSEDFLSAYAHNQRLLVKEGQSVVLGQQIAEMGNSGTTQTKLHFEIRKNGKPVNPLKYLPLQRG